MATKEKNVKDIITAVTKAKAKLDKEIPKQQIEGLRDALREELKNAGGIWGKTIFKQMSTKLGKLQTLFEGCQKIIDPVIPKGQELFVDFGARAQPVVADLEKLSYKFRCAASTMARVGAFCGKIANTEYGTSEHHAFVDTDDFNRRNDYITILQNRIDDELAYFERAFTDVVNAANALLA